MLYPANIKSDNKYKIQIIMKNVQKLKKEIKRKVKYFIFDRSNLVEKLLIKLHI